MRRSVLALCAAALLAASPAAADHGGRYDQALEPGFVVTPYAVGAVTPTALTFGPGGELYVATVAGTIHRYRDLGGVAGPPEVLVDGLDYPLGLEVGPDGALYVTHIARRDGDRSWGAVTRIDIASTGAVSGVRPVLVDLPQGHSQTNGLSFGPDGLLYVANGASTDDGVGGGPPDVAPLSGSVVRFDPSDAADAPLSAMRYRGSGADPEHEVDIVATGLRNHYDIVFGGAHAYMTMNGPETTDPYADDLLLRIEDAPSRSLGAGTAADFGFPGCLYTHRDGGWPVAHTSPHPLLPDEEKTCQGVVPPLVSFGLHPSTNGLDIAPAGFGALGGHVFAAQWGSFSGVRGHKVVRVGIGAEGEVIQRPDGTPDIADFALVPAPIDLEFHDGALYVVDFDSGIVFRAVPVA